MGDVELLQYFLATGYDVDDSTASEEFPALAQAVMSQKPKAVQFLIDSGATVDKNVIKFVTTIEIFDILRSHVDQKLLETCGAFQTASRYGNRELVMHMLSTGIDVNCRHDGVTALMTAVMRKDSSEMIKLLLSKGANVSLQDVEFGDTACAFPTYSFHTGTDVNSAQCFLLM